MPSYCLNCACMRAFIVDHSCSEAHDTGNNVQLRVRAASHSLHEGVLHMYPRHRPSMNNEPSRNVIHPWSSIGIASISARMQKASGPRCMVHGLMLELAVSTHARGYVSQCQFKASAKDNSHSGRAMAEATSYHPGRATSCMWLACPCRSHGKKLCVAAARSKINHTRTQQHQNSMHC
jgi:hypothetical protein